MSAVITLSEVEFNAIRAALANARACITDRDDYTMDDLLADHCREETAHALMLMDGAKAKAGDA